MTTPPDDAWAPVQGAAASGGHPVADERESRKSSGRHTRSEHSAPGAGPAAVVTTESVASSTTGSPAPEQAELSGAPAGPPDTTAPLPTASSEPVPSMSSAPEQPPSPVAVPAADTPPPYSAGASQQPGTSPRARRGVRGGVVALLMLVALLVGVVAGLVGARWLLPLTDPQPVGLPTAAPGGGTEGEPQSGNWISDIAAAALPSTVYIEVRLAGEAVSGSGFVVREDGYIVTNDHVVAGADDGAGEITIVFSDGTEESAEIVGSTADYDLAVLQIDRTGLTPLVLGDSDSLAVGDPVIAVGAPLGLSGSVTSGIVSAVDRPVTVRSPEASGDDPSTYINAVQTDAAINRGNSGGPLIDGAGQVIGVNTAVARDPSSSGGGNEPGFAIPSTQVRHTVEQIISTGVATYPVVGVLLDVEYEGEGVRVRSEDVEGTPAVTPGGPADQAGIEPGDVIVAVDGDPVSDPTELIVRVRSHLPGETTVLTLRTDDGDRDVEVVLGEQVSE